MRLRIIIRKEVGAFYTIKNKRQYKQRKRESKGLENNSIVLEIIYGSN